MTSNTAQILSDAKSLLQEKGRITVDLINRDDCMCALGAVAVATVGKERLLDDRYLIFQPHSSYSSEEAISAVKALADEIYDGVSYKRERFDADYEVVWRYNDASGRTDEEVMDIFDRAIKAVTDLDA